MYSRIITCTIDPSRVDEFRTVLNQEFLPRIQKQPVLSRTLNRWTVEPVSSAARHSGTPNQTSKTMIAVCSRKWRLNWDR